ncbi:MAG: HEAT repeat domain-containing protein [Pirellulaceae bacterium]
MPARQTKTLQNNLRRQLAETLLMFGWLFPRPPLDALEKAWVETRMLWLAHRLGIARMLGTSVVWPPDFPTGPWDGTAENVRQLLQRLGDQLQIETRTWNLEILPDEPPSNSPGNRVPGIVHVAEQQLDDPESLTATIAHQLAHAWLPPESLTWRDVREREWLADLVAVCLGLGVFIAQAVVQDMSDAEGHFRCRSMRHFGYLPARRVGYAMALFAWVRGESRPAWRAELRLDAQVALNGGLRYLQRTEDSVFSLETAGRPHAARPTDQLLQQLMTGSPSARIAALWELRSSEHAAAAAHAVTRCLHDSRPAIRQEAAHTLSVYGEEARPAIIPLMDLLQDAQYAVRSAAATTLGALGQEMESVLPGVAELLRDPDREVVRSAATALGSFGERGLSAELQVLAALKAALIRCDHALIDALTHTLFAIDPDPTDRVLQYFADDYEMREQMVHLIVDAVRPPDTDNPDSDNPDSDQQA